MSTIPKIIHQIWFQGISCIPQKYIAFQNTWKDQTTFKYEFWDETRINDLMKHFPVFEKTYLSFPTIIQKIDFAKYLILYLIGGVYIDMDVFAIKDLDVFLIEHREKSFIVFEHNTPLITIIVNKFMGLCGNKIINNAVIFCSKRNAKMLTIIGKCMDAQADWRKNLLSHHSRCLITTGPIVFTNCIRKMPDWRSCLLSSEIFEPYTTLDLVEMSDGVNKIETNGFVDYKKMMTFLKTAKPMGNTIGIHVLDLNWSKSGKNDWKFRVFKNMQKLSLRLSHS